MDEQRLKELRIAARRAAANALMDSPDFVGLRPGCDNINAEVYHEIWMNGCDITNVIHAVVDEVVIQLDVLQTPTKRKTFWRRLHAIFWGDW